MANIIPEKSRSLIIKGPSTEFLGGRLENLIKLKVLAPILSSPEDLDRVTAKWQITTLFKPQCSQQFQLHGVTPKSVFNILFPSVEDVRLIRESRRKLLLELGEGYPYGIFEGLDDSEREMFCRLLRKKWVLRLQGRRSRIYRNRYLIVTNPNNTESYFKAKAWKVKAIPMIPNYVRGVERLVGGGGTEPGWSYLV